MPAPYVTISLHRSRFRCSWRRNVEAVVEKVRTTFVNGGQWVEDHFVEITEMIEIGTGRHR
jgi:hypothetical protein